MPKTMQGWVYFTAAVFIAGAIINSVARRIPQLAAIGGGI